MKKLNFKIEEKECILYTNENKKIEYINNNNIKSIRIKNINKNIY